MRRAPSANYNGVNLHELADRRGLFWIGGPGSAYDYARHFLQYTAEELRRVTLDRGYHQLQSMQEGGAAFLYWPGDDDFAGRAHWREIHALLMHRKWTVFDAEQFLATIEGRHRPWLGVDLASGPDVTAFQVGDQVYSAGEFAELAKSIFSSSISRAAPAAPVKRGVDKYMTPEIEERLRRLSK